MKFKGRVIQAGDVLYTADGKAFVISDWSYGTGGIYGRMGDRFGAYTSVKEMPELYWNYPFISHRRREATE